MASAMEVAEVEYGRIFFVVNDTFLWDDVDIAFHRTADVQNRSQFPQIRKPPFTAPCVMPTRQSAVVPYMM